MELSFVTRSLFVLVALTGLSCGSNKQDSAQPIQAQCQEMPGRYLAAMATNYETGYVRFIDLESGKVEEKTAPADSDAVVRTFAGDNCLYVVNRKGADNIQVVDPKSRQIVKQFSVGRNTNPHDIVVDGDFVYVSRHRAAKLARFNLQSGELDKEWDMPQDVDGFGEMSWMERVGDKIFIVMQLLDMRTIQALPTREAKLAVFDMLSESITEYDLKLKNPYPRLARQGENTLFVGAVGRFRVYDETSGGIERVDLTTMRSEVVIDERGLGGSLVDLKLVGTDKAVAIVAASTAKTKMIEVDLRGGRVVREIVTAGGYHFSGLLFEASKQRLYLFDRNPSKSGIRTFEARSLRELDTFFRVGLPPSMGSFL